jgi:CheY-like chemotaxis protein
VEDDDSMRDIIRRNLTKAGCKVVEAENGRVALDQLATALPDLIVLDLMMPEMDGFQFLDKLYSTEEWRTIPVIVVTAHELEPEQETFLNQRTQRVIHKTAFNRERLMHEIRALVQ